MIYNKPKRFFIYSNSGGCPQNQLDGGRIVSYLQKNGYVCSKKNSDSDVVIINSCSYNNLKESQSFEQSIKFNNISKNRKLVLLTGCLPKIAPHKLSDLPKDIMVIPGCELDRIEEIIPPVNVNWKQIHINYIPEPLFRYSKRFRQFLFSILSLLRHNLPLRAVRHFDHLLMYDHTPKSFIVEISKGCLGSCTYCVIRCSRGRLKSRPIEEITDEIKTGIKNDITEILLTATETAAYGLDIGTNFSTLLKDILNIITNQKLLIFYANPKWLIKDWNNLESVFASGKIHFIHLSLNGGSNNVLKNMNRGYTLEEFENLIIAIKKSSPSTVLQTQIITGFPGETEADFKTTLDFFRRTYFHNVQVHTFDPRKGTEAATMPEQIPDDIKQKRRRILYRLTLKRKAAYNLKYIISGFKPIPN
jgi:threonylcarbamoyladenosine tRNA methylthiotransferase CDKAL1